MAALWRQKTELHPTFAPRNRCLPEDWFLLPYELKLQRAHGEALRAAGILSTAEFDALCAALEHLEQQYGGADCPESDTEDLHTWVEAALTTLAGDVGRRIHTARSRNDQVATLLALYAVDAGRQLRAQLGQLIECCCARAAAWADIAMPLHTHQQFAAPGSAGFWILRFVAGFERVRRRLEWCVNEWRQTCPLGSGAVAGSSVPIDRAIQARALGFAAPSPNALDSTSTRDACLELLAVGTQLALHLQSLAADVILFAQTPLGWIRYPPAFATGSSMMPNKANPDAMELLRGECNAVFAAQVEVVAILKGLPSGYNRDLQCIKPALRRGMETLHGLLAMTTAFVEQLAFDEARCAAALQLGHVGATLRMEEHVQAGEPLRSAHHAVAEEVAAGADPADPRIVDPLYRYATAGGSHPDEVRRLAAEFRSRLRAK
jgi:argininosuccinate lyase